jgi:hypothetical protein
MKNIAPSNNPNRSGTKEIFYFSAKSHRNQHKLNDLQAEKTAPYSPSMPVWTL